jgi:GNAT superfamily N-acetyltransferase
VFELTPVELIGYAASALVVLSLAMSSVVRLRLLSLAGSCTFLIYAVQIRSVPIIITNLAIACINIWYLRLELLLKRHLGVTPLPVPSPFLDNFLAYHLDDMRRFQPDFTIPADDAGDVVALLLTRDSLPAGVLIGRRDGDTLHIIADYVLKSYRDSRLGSWLFGEGTDVFRSIGIARLVSLPGSEAHRSYLDQVGFRPEGNRYVLEVDEREARER